jgi:hypothetical protein
MRSSCPQRGIAAREAHGGEGRIWQARFPARKSLEEFDYDHARSLNAEIIAHLATLNFVRPRRTWSSPAHSTRQALTHLAMGLGICACRAGRRVLFAPPPSGSPGWPTPTAPGGCSQSWCGWPECAAGYFVADTSRATMRVHTSEHQERGRA